MKYELNTLYCPNFTADTVTVQCTPIAIRSTVRR